MRRFQNYPLGIDQGSDALFSAFEDGGDMWTGKGPREVRKQISFSTEFRKPPVVTVALGMFDMDQKTNQRADLLHENVTTTGFEIVFKTWGDTRIARVRADWTAIGELTDEEIWEVY